MMRRTWPAWVAVAGWLACTAVAAAQPPQDEQEQPPPTEAEGAEAGDESQDAGDPEDEPGTAPDASEPAGEGDEAGDGAADAPAAAGAEDAAASEPSEGLGDGAAAPSVPDGYQEPAADGEQGPAEPQEPGEGEVEAPEPYFDAGVEDGIFDTRLYGFIDGQYKDQFGPWPDAELRPPAHRPGFSLDMTAMLQGSVMGRFRYFLILAAPVSQSADLDHPIRVRNAWVEAAAYRDFLNIRVGKIYRRFGLYNEILDATPTFIGTEPPAYLNPGQLLLTRTTNLMVHGSFSRGEHSLSYAVMTGNDERGKSDVFPIGGDLRYTFAGQLTLGTSAYWSGGAATPTQDVGTSATQGGVVNYMAKDEFYVYGGFAEYRNAGLLLQAAYFRGSHDAQRDPAKVGSLPPPFIMGKLNDRQRGRLFDKPCLEMEQMKDPEERDLSACVNAAASYDVQTFYMRAGYEIPLGKLGALTPYAHFDLYDHEEAIPGPQFGGNEAGLSDDHRFFRVTPGLMYRPIPAVALKVELNNRIQDVGGQTEWFREFRSSLSYLWEL